MSRRWLTPLGYSLGLFFGRFRRVQSSMTLARDELSLVSFSSVLSVSAISFGDTLIGPAAGQLQARAIALPTVVQTQRGSEDYGSIP